MTISRAVGRPKEINKLPAVDPFLVIGLVRSDERDISFESWTKPPWNTFRAEHASAYPVVIDSVLREELSVSTVSRKHIVSSPERIYIKIHLSIQPDVQIKMMSCCNQSHALQFCESFVPRFKIFVPSTCPPEQITVFCSVRNDSPRKACS